MELGEKLRQARLEAGLSQRQLCGGEITRNMLSQIEHGTAKPSMATLRYLAGQLGKSVSYFLDEDSLSSPNQMVMEKARAAFDAGAISKAVQALEDYRGPDPVYDRERNLLENLLCLSLARSAIDQGKDVLARTLLEDLRISGYAAPELERRRRLLLGRLPGMRYQEICMGLPSLDAELLLRAGAALEAEDYQRGICLLKAVERQEDPKVSLLLGQMYLGKEDYHEAAACFCRVQETYPMDTAVFLERCYRELGDYQQAYFYACKQRDLSGK